MNKETHSETSQSTELPQPLTKKQPTVLTGWQLFAKATLLSLGITLVLLFITGIAIGAWGYTKLDTFLTHAELTLPETRTLLETGLESEPKHTENITTILFMGLDSLDTRPGSPQLTDTMMLIFINYDTGQITTLPLPRDIWSDAYKTKINALYHYGLERYPNEPERFPREVISELTQLPIHYTMVVSMDTVSDLIDLMGGLTLDIPTGFTDAAFPRTDVDVTQVSDPSLLYETVSFEAGEQTLPSSKVLQYIRSRKSSDEVEGTDLARSKRQQLVISSIAAQLLQPETLKNPILMGTLFQFYNHTFSSQLPIIDAISIAKKIQPVSHDVHIQTATIPVYPEDQEGVITHPPQAKYSVWVYEVLSPELFRNYVQTQIK